MRKEEISLPQGISMMVMFILGSSLIIGGETEAQKDSWLAIPVGAIMAAPMYFIYARFKKILPGMDLYEILQWTLGKIPSKACIVLFTWFSLHLGALVIRNFTEFIEAMALPSTPQFVTAIMLGLVTIWAVKSGMATMGTWCIIFLFVVLFVFSITLLAGFSQYDINNIKPIAEKGISKLVEGGTSVFAFPFAEIVIFLLAFGNYKAKTSPYKMWYVSLIIGCGVLLLASVRNLLILGEQIYVSRHYSSYSAAMVTTLGDFLSRFEVIVGTNFLLCGFAKITICLFAASKGVSKILSIPDYKIIAAPVGLLMIIFSIIVYSSATEMFDWLVVSKYYKLPFEVIIPVIVWMLAEAKVKFYAHFKKSLPVIT